MEGSDVPDPSPEHTTLRDMRIVTGRLSTAVKDALARDRELSLAEGVNRHVWHMTAIDVVCDVFQRALIAPLLDPSGADEIGCVSVDDLVVEMWVRLDRDLQEAGMSDLPEHRWSRRYLLTKYQGMLTERIYENPNTVTRPSGAGTD
jgi:hypothetical protein